MSQENNVNEVSEILESTNETLEVIDSVTTADDIEKQFKKAQLRNTLVVIGIILAVIGSYFVYQWQANSRLQYIGGNELSIMRNGQSTTGSVWKNDSFITQLTWASLFETDASFTEVNPYLAETLEMSSDGLTYTITLKDDLKWSDGTPLTVDDVVWSIETFSLSDGTNTTITNAFSYIVGMEKWQEIGYDSWLNGDTYVLEGLSTSGNQITIKLDTAYNAFGVALTQFIVLPKHILEDYNPTTYVLNSPLSDFFRNPVCSGMYKVDYIDDLDDMHLVHNEYYCREFSDIETVVMYGDYQNMNLGYYTTNNITEMVSYRAMTGFEEHYVDVEWYRYFVFNLMAGFEQPEMIPELDEDGNEVYDANGDVVLVAKVTEYDDTREENYPMQDIKVRQAISLALDREALSAEVYQKTATYDFSTTGNSTYSDFLCDYNVEKAKQLLAESDYDLSRPLTIGYYHTDINTTAFLNRVKAYLEEIGFSVIIKYTSGATALYDVREYDFYLKAYPAYSIIDWYNEYLTTNTVLHAIMGTDEFDDLLVALGASTSITEYNSILAELQVLDSQTMYKLPLVSLKDAVYIDGNRVSVPDDMEFGNVRFRSALRLSEWSIKKD